MLPTIDQIMKAKSLSDLSDDPDKLYKKLARKYHPDRYEGDSRVFKHINKIHKEVKSPKPTIKSKRHEYTPVFKDKNVYTVEYDAGFKSALMYVYKKHEDADNFRDSLKKLDEVPDNYREFFPHLLDSFDYAQSNGKVHVVVTDLKEGFVPYANILKKYPGGISGRNVAWIFRRMLVAVGNSHDIGMYHGNITQDSFLINAPEHGLVLTGFSDGSSFSEDIKAVAKVARETLDSSDPTARPLTAFFKGCMLSNVPEAKYLLAEFDELLLRIYGKPKFTKLEL